MFRNLPLNGQIEFYFTTCDSTGAPVAPSAAFTAADFAIHKNGSATQKTTANGITVTSRFDSKVGLHLVVIDTSNTTGDAGFWASGGRYQVRFATATTVAAVSVDGRLVPHGAFGIESEYISEEIMDAVAANSVKLDTIALKTALITAGRIRVLSRVAGSLITAKAGDDHLVAANNALTLEIDDDDCALYQFLRDATHTALEFGAGRDNMRDEITADIDSSEITHVGTQTYVPIELAAADTVSLRAGEYAFDIQATTAAGHKVTRQALEGTLILTADRKS